MKTNTNSVNTWIGVDHVQFDTAPAGTHKQVTISSKNAPGAQTDPQAVIYTGNGSASTVAEMYYRNQSGIFPISMVRAFGVFDGAAALLNGSNLTAVNNSTGVYTLTIAANAVGSVNYGILIGIRNNALNPASTANYTILSATSAQVAFRNGSSVLFNPDGFTILVIQI